MGTNMAQQKKYEFVPGDEKVVAPGRTVKRIRALIAIAALGVAFYVLHTKKNLLNN
jgi:hypothetical protein